MCAVPVTAADNADEEKRRWRNDHRCEHTASNSRNHEPPKKNKRLARTGAHSGDNTCNAVVGLRSEIVHYEMTGLTSVRREFTRLDFLLTAREPWRFARNDFDFAFSMWFQSTILRFLIFK
jgi:hypothetical protein